MTAYNADSKKQMHDIASIFVRQVSKTVDVSKGAAHAVQFTADAFSFARLWAKTFAQTKLLRTGHLAHALADPTTL